MRAGGGQPKGAKFERYTGQTLSLWVSYGERKELFSRNVLSGGRFTNAIIAGKTEVGMPGDVVAAHPMAFELLSLFCIECKHHKSLELDRFLLDTKDTSWMTKVINKIAAEAEATDLHWMVVAKQNFKPAMILMDYSSGMYALSAAGDRGLPHHMLFSGRIIMAQFEQFVKLVDPDTFFRMVKTKGGHYVVDERPASNSEPRSRRQVGHIRRPVLIDKDGPEIKNTRGPRRHARPAHKRPRKPLD